MGTQTLRAAIDFSSQGACYVRQSTSNPTPPVREMWTRPPSICYIASRYLSLTQDIWWNDLRLTILK